MKVRFEPDFGGIGEAMRLPGVRQAIGDRAREIASTAGAAAASAGIGRVDWEVVESTRSDGRPEAQVRGEADGGDEANRSRLLTALRAAGGGV